VSHRVVFSPEARGDLTELYDYIADPASAEIALAYLTRIETCCLDLGYLSRTRDPT
jgi:plasmid stabilization system protein ParE